MVTRQGSLGQLIHRDWTRYWIWTILKNGICTNCCILIKCECTSLIILIQIQTVRTSLFLPTFSPWRHEDRDTNHKSIRELYNSAHLTLASYLVVFKVSIHLCLSRPKLNRDLQRSTSTKLSFHNLQILKTSLPGMTSFALSIYSNGRSATFSVWEFIMTYDYWHILSAGE